MKEEWRDRHSFLCEVTEGDNSREAPVGDPRVSAASGTVSRGMPSARWYIGRCASSAGEGFGQVRLRPFVLRPVR